MVESDLRQFDYKKVAKLDAAMWRAYYNHQFVKLFFQLLQVMRTQLHLNWYLTAKLAYFSGRAAKDYRLKKGNEDYKMTLASLIKYYNLLSKHSTKPFDYKKAARLELEWWDIHRYPKKYKKTLEKSLAEAAAAIYGVKPITLTEYARFRAEAMMIPDHEGDNQKIKPDWQKVESLLTKSWRSLHQSVQ